MQQKFYLLLIFLVLITITKVSAQTKTFTFDDDFNNDALFPDFVAVYPDSLTTDFNEIKSKKALFNTAYIRAVQNFDLQYWLKIELNYAGSFEKRYYIELTDSHIDSITAYFQTADGSYDIFRTGNAYDFSNKQLDHKNFVFPLNFYNARNKIIYFKISSDSPTSFSIKLRSENSLIKFTEMEYYLLGAFYGVLFIMLVSNFVLAIFIREKSYTYYCFYILTAALLFLTEDGLGYQYIWPGFPLLNNFFESFAPVALLIAFTFYSFSFLDIHKRLFRFKKIIYWAIVGSTILSVINYLVFSTIVYWLYLIPYLLIYYSSLRIYKRGFKTAGYFAAAHIFIIVGFLFLIFRRTGVDFLLNIYTIYSLNFAFIIEISLLSYALGEKFQKVKRKELKAKERAISQLKKKQSIQKKLVNQLRQNESLKDKVNRELEQEVSLRTQEINEKKEQIETQNEQLQSVNLKLKEQSNKINEMNRLLDMNNWNLKKEVKRVEEEKVLLKGISYDEFLKVFPNDDACLRFLANTKWNEGFSCIRCGNEKYSDGKTPYSRRCTKCRYEESATVHTLLHKCKFPLTKAFYAVFLLFHEQGNITSVKLSEKLDLRQSTCWNFSKKVMDAMEKTSTERKDEMGWVAVIFNEVEKVK